MAEVTEHHAEGVESEIHKASIVKQVVKNRDHVLDVVREALSNTCAQEVGATEVQVKYYRSEYGATFVFEDDGCGMGFSGDDENPRRLDRFINLGFSGAAGLDSDEYSHKGLGSMLLLDCKELTIETWNGDPSESFYEVKVRNPREKLFGSDEPLLPKFELIRRDPIENMGSGTKIVAKGYGGGDIDFARRDIEQYLHYHSVVGCTDGERVSQLPEIYINHKGDTKEIEPGFPWIESEADWRTVVVDPPIGTSVESKQSETEVQVTLKGGFTMNTANPPYGLSVHRGNVGIFASVNGIPYFRVPYDDTYTGEKFKGIYKKFACFVVECDELHEVLTIDRSSTTQDNDILPAFKKACRQAFSELAQREAYNEFQRNRREESRRERAELLSERKEALRTGEVGYVYLDTSILEGGSDEGRSEEHLLHRVPSGENDTLSLLWKLEALDALPFQQFTTLEHTANKGIDTIVNYQIDDMSEPNEFVACEIESKFENFERHGHYPGQSSLIVCWEIEHPNVDKLEQVNEYRYRATFGEHSIEVFEIQNMPGIGVRNSLDT